MAVTHWSSGTRKRVLQKGHVLYAHKAQKVIQRKEDDDLLEAQLAVIRAQANVY